MTAAGPAAGAAGPVLRVDGLDVDIALRRSVVHAVRDVSLEVAAGETVGIVGESGCGKSTLGLALAGLLPSNAVTRGSIRVGGREVTGVGERELRAIRGAEVGIVFQDPMTSLNPTQRIGAQVGEALRLHRGASREAARAAAADMLDLVGLPRPREQLDRFPHELSGGMRQRAVIAAALICEPKVLIADEPTTALDVTIQAQILDLLAREQRRRHMAMILITHDLGVVAGRTDEVAVMYAGRVVERAPTRALFKNMRMPYTEALLAAIPKLDAAPHTPLPAISGRPPDPTRPIQGCSFSPRCRYATGPCHRDKPPLTGAGTPDHQYACFHPIQIAAGVDA